SPARDRRAKQTGWVEGETTARMVDSPARGAAAPTTRRFAGAYVLPGLIDMHVHFASYPDRDLFALLFLAHGVTAVRDTGNFDGSIWQTRESIAAGQFPRPPSFSRRPPLFRDPPVRPPAPGVRPPHH